MLLTDPILPFPNPYDNEPEDSELLDPITIFVKIYNSSKLGNFSPILFQKKKQEKKNMLLRLSITAFWCLFNELDAAWIFIMLRLQNLLFFNNILNFFFYVTVSVYCERMWFQKPTQSIKTTLYQCSRNDRGRSWSKRASKVDHGQLEENWMLPMQKRMHSGNVTSPFVSFTQRLV